MDKKLLAKHHEIISQKFLIPKEHKILQSPYSSSHQTTELPPSEISFLSAEKKPQTVFHFKQFQGDDFLTLKQTKIPSIKLRINLEKTPKLPFFTHRMTYKSLKYDQGFLTDRDRIEQSPLKQKVEFLMKSRGKTEQKSRKNTLNEIEFKEKFLLNKRRASKPNDNEKSLVSLLKIPLSLSLTSRMDLQQKTKEKINDPMENNPKKPCFQTAKQPISPSSKKDSKHSIRKSRKPRNKDQISNFNHVFERNPLSDIFQSGIPNPTIFKEFKNSLNYKKNPKDKDIIFKLSTKDHEKILLRYNPIQPQKKQWDSLKTFASDKELELFNNKGFAETALCGENFKPIDQVEREKERSEIQKEFRSITTRLYQNLSKTPNNQVLHEGLNLKIGFRLALSQIEYLKQEFQKGGGGMDISNVDYMLKGLKFFSKFSETIRLHFIKRAKFIEYPANQIIFKEGDFGDLMYIILRGSVNIRVLKHLDIYKDESCSLVVNSFYDGDQFGDLAMMSVKQSNSTLLKSKALTSNVHRIKDVRKYLQKCEEILETNIRRPSFNKEAEKEYLGIQENQENNTLERTKRAATIETVEQCYFLTLARGEYQYIYTHILQKSLEDRLNILMTGNTFSSIEAYNLLPLANILEEKVYKLGEPVIKLGELVESFHIISKGKCDLVLEYKDYRTINSRFLNKGIKMKEIGDPIIFEKSKKNPIRKLDTEPFIIEGEEEELSPRNFPNSKKTREKNIEISINHEIIRSFLKGDCFGERALLTNIDLDNKAQIFKKEMIPRRARLSVLADMNLTKVYSIKSSAYQSIPVELRNKIRSIFIETPEFDDYDVSELENEQKNWGKIKEQVIKLKKDEEIYKKGQNLYKLSHIE